MSLSYDFAGPHARVVATRVATVGGRARGENAREREQQLQQQQQRHRRSAASAAAAAAGEVIWTASAAPLGKPWPAKEAALVAMRASLAGGDDHLGRRGGRVGEREVVEVSRGRGLVERGGGGDADGGTDDGADAWCEGRLWRYADGGLAFVWLPRQPAGGERLVDYERVEVARERRRSKKKRKKRKKRGSKTERR